MPRFTCFLVGFLVLACFVRPDGARAGESQRFACNLRALTSNQRTIHDRLTRRLFASVLERRETPSGFGFRVDSNKFTLLDLATWAEAERLCCPFLSFAIEKEPRDGPLWLRLTGPDGVKDFLLAEMGSGAR